MNTVFEKLSPWASLAGRLLIALIFILTGYSKIGGFEGTQAYMTAMGVPGALLPLVIITELLGGLLIVVGLFTRYAAFALAGFSILAAVIFHGDTSDQTQYLFLLKNLAIAGGFLFLVANGPGSISLDHLRARK